MQYMIRLRDATGTFSVSINADTEADAIAAAVAHCEGTGCEYVGGPDE